MPKGRIMNWWQFIDIKYVGHNITSTDIDINNKDKVIILLQVILMIVVAMF